MVILGGVLENKGDYFLFITLVIIIIIRLVQKISGSTKLICSAFPGQLHLGSNETVEIATILSTLKWVFINKLCDEMEYTHRMFLLHTPLQMFTGERESCELFELLTELATFPMTYSFT